MGAPSVSDKDFVVEEGPRADARAGGLTMAPDEQTDSPIGHIAKRAVKGAGEQIGRDIEANLVMDREGLAGIPEALLRMFLPREWVDKVFPDGGLMNPKLEVTDPITGVKSKKSLRALTTNKDTFYSPESFAKRANVGSPPGDVSDTLGAAAEGFGSFVGNPVGGPANLTRSALMAMGSGMGSHLLGKGGGSLGKTIGDMWDSWFGSKGSGETGEKVGEVGGSLAGGAVGGQVNVMRGKALGAAKQAADNAFRLRKEESRASVLENMRDNYSDMHAEAKGVVQEHVNEKLAEALQKNPDTPKNLTEFEEAANRIGIDPKTYDLAQRTNDPSLVVALKTQQPKTLDEAQELVRKNQAQRKEVVKAFESATGQSARAKDVVDSMEDFRKATNGKIVALEAVKKREQDALSHLTPEDRAKQGEGLRAAYEAKKEEVKPIRDSWYSKAKTADGLDPKHYDLSSVERDVKGMLDETLVRMKPEVVPESIVKLNNLLKKAKGTPDKIERVEKRPGFYVNEVVEQGTKAQPITYSDMEDMFKALNREVPKDATEARNLAMVKDSLYKAFSKQAGPDLKKAFDEAQEKYRTQYAPMFKEGVNFNLDRRASISRKGDSYYSPDMGLKPYLDEKRLVSNMTEFDNLFGGGKLGKRDERAYQELGKAIQDKYYGEMFQGGKYTQAKHDQFLSRFGPVFDRVPKAKEAIETQAKKVFDLQGQMARVEQDYREAVKSPLNQTLGVYKADELVSRALTDPRTMNRLVRGMKEHGGVESLMKDVTGRFSLYDGDVFNPQKMEKVLTDSAPGLMVLFKEALGSEAAATKHFDTLKDIALVAKRQQLMELRGLPPSERVGADPIRGATGSSGASVINDLRAAATGRTSIEYVGVSASGRFLNQSLQNALREAEKRAFNDPAMAQAVLELYTKKAGEQVTGKTARKIASGAGDMASKLFDWMVDRGYVKSTMGKGAQIGVTTYTEDKDQ